VKNYKKEINLLDISRTKYKISRSDEVRTTDINILLNRVSLDKKKEFRKKIIFFSKLVLSVSIVGIFSLI